MLWKDGQIDDNDISRLKTVDVDRWTSAMVAVLTWSVREMAGLYEEGGGDKVPSIARGFCDEPRV